MMELKIKDGKLADFKKMVGENSTDLYSFAAVQAAVHTMGLLGSGMSPNEAQEEGFKGKDLTGFLAGCASNMISSFDARGDEFRKHWNARYGVDEDTDGVVNPAILTIGGA